MKVIRNFVYSLSIGSMGCEKKEFVAAFSDFESLKRYIKNNPESAERVSANLDWDRVQELVKSLDQIPEETDNMDFLYFNPEKEPGLKSVKLQMNDVEHYYSIEVVPHIVVIMED